MITSLLFACLALAHADNDPATGMYSPKAHLSDGGETCMAPPSAHATRFYADASCQYSCANDSTIHTGSRELAWDPASEPGMFQGDGNLWATMTQRLTNKGRRTCLEAATVGCKRMELVREFSYTGMASGAWKMPAQILCGPGQPLAYSPYDNTMASALRRQANSSHAPVQIIAELSADGGKSKAPVKDCKKEITVNVCFGDCLCEPGAVADCPKRSDGRWAEVLGTSKPPATRVLKICADTLVAELAAAKMTGYSHDVLQFYCEDYAWRTVFLRKPTGATCSAYRGTVDCSSLF